jgi:16S rRNA (guanine966-N2)-methyltransferase
MRIVAGKHRGRAIEAPPGADVRPTGDRARQALFNILEHGRFATNGSPIVGQRVLDAFAGTGALGLEALSRGAGHVTFMELAPKSRGQLKENIQRLGETANATVLPIDVTKPSRATEPCGLAFLDAPYGNDLTAPSLIALAAAGWLNVGAIVVVEIGAKEDLTVPAGFTLETERIYGAAKLLFLRHG